MGFSLIKKLIFSTGKTAEAGCPEIEIEEELMLAKRKIIFKNYTIVELLVVILVVGILLGISAAGINGMLKRQGASGAVRSISSKLALCRSYATVKNSYVALLLPNDNPNPPGDPATLGKYNSGFTANDRLKQFLYTKSRLCLVTPSVTIVGDYTFDSWIDGNEWDDLPAGTCAYISANPVRVGNIIINTGGSDYTVTSSAVVFKPNGMLANGSNILIKAFMARYILTASGGVLVYETKAGQNNAWEISINPFTGKTSYAKKTDN